MDESQPPAARTLPEVEFALVISRTINALNEDPSLLRSTVYELARVKLRKDLFGGDLEQTQQLTQALETAIQGVEDFEVRQKGTAGHSGSIAGPMNKLSETARPMAPTLPAVEVYTPSQQRPTGVPLIDHPTFETRGNRRALEHDIPATHYGSIKRAFRLLLWAALGIFVGWVVITNRDGIRSFVANRTGSPKPPAVATVASPTAVDQSATMPAPAQTPTIPAPPPIPGLPLPTTYGNYAINNGELAELELLQGQVPDKRVAVSTPIQTASHTILPDGSPTFVVFRRDLATIPTDGIEARVVARIRHTMKFDGQAKQPTYTQEELWSIRPFVYKFRSAPIPGNPEMMLIKPDNVVLPPGRYILVLKRQGYDFTVAGKITEPDQCLERTEAANGSFYSPCSNLP